MIAALPGWRTTLHGDTCVLAPNDAPHAASIRYRERVRPMCPLRERVAGAARTLAVESPVVERVITLEGEYAALCHLEGIDQRDGRRWLVSVGLVFGDDFHSELWGRSDSPARFLPVQTSLKRSAGWVSLSYSEPRFCGSPGTGRRADGRRVRRGS